jgi:two-component system C4-dicarboxylate transport sensor histidine kinase DctB
MAKISNQLRSFTRKSDSNEVSKLDIKPLILSAKELLAAQCKAKQVDLRLDLEQQLPNVELNPIQFEQVLINLVTNAMQALEQQDQRTIEISATVSDSHIAIFVDDNGPGIAYSEQHQLFEPFYTTKKNGLGLGLSISQQITQAMGGSLDIADSPLGGARFVITLPVEA